MSSRKGQAYVGIFMLILLASGVASLSYQIVWMRIFRLLFGMSTQASAAVVATFMGGLGLGAWYWGKRCDSSKRPLRMYAGLELGIGLTVAATPFLLDLIYQLYPFVPNWIAENAVLRLLFLLLSTASAILLPTMLMGGTLPVACRCLAIDRDNSRRLTAAAYALNTVGAVIGTCVANFWSLEVLGNHLTLWIGCSINILIAVVVMLMAHREQFQLATITSLSEDQAQPKVQQTQRERLILFATALVLGFVFFLMELVWYRMLAPIFGASIYCFGLILATVLLGIGLGSLLYVLLPHKRLGNPRTLAFTVLLEALVVALPFALGDKIAIWTMHLSQNWRVLSGFSGLVASWLCILLVVVFPVAFVSGYQFPLLVSLLGMNKYRVGDDVGKAYFWNTVGAVLGALAGGFGFLPMFTATGCWQIAAFLLLGVAMFLSITPNVSQVKLLRSALLPLGLALVITMLLVIPTGPTSAWRHTQIGVGIETIPHGERATQDWLHQKRNQIKWSVEGREVSLAMVSTSSGYSFNVNGKIDGSARADAEDQIMGGLLAPLLHPAPKSGLVIGLGSGQSAGWMATMPLVESVDVLELEPAMLRVARDLASTNQHVLNNPKVTIRIGDAQELIRRSAPKYDVIFSEPSNPYRAGVASLYTQEFYREIDRVLNADGIFVQWIQTYNISPETIASIYITLRSVFSSVEIWRSNWDSLHFVVRKRRRNLDISELRKRLEIPLVRKGLAVSRWKMDVEGLLSHFIAEENSSELLQNSASIVTEDRNLVEFGLAKSLRSRSRFEIPVHLSAALQSLPDTIPVAQIDEKRLHSERLPPGTRDTRMSATELYSQGQVALALREWNKQTPEQQTPTTLQQLELVAEALADSEDRGRALKAIQSLGEISPAAENFLLSKLAFREGNEKAVDYLTLAIKHAQTDDPWASDPLVERAMASAVDFAKDRPSTGLVIFELLRSPFLAGLYENLRRSLLLDLAKKLQHLDSSLCIAGYEAWEPWIPWSEDFLVDRHACYKRNSHALTDRAAKDLQRFRSQSRYQ